ncbi:MAG: hypothetical protein E4H10_12110 [Bacteroidia bacterium]|jgi:hypothetical protein|nr:MAG: hypothetical protein E4H10_12110 [Bacteroidia bacterium]
MKKTFFLLALILPVCTVIAQLPEPIIPVALNYSDVDQVGGFNHATVSQDGTYNWSTVNTLGIGNAESSVVQTGSMNNSTANQDGWFNSVNVIQKNAYLQTTEENLNFSWINQLGNGNYAEVNQEHDKYNGRDLPGTLDAFALQTGNGNESMQHQKGMRDVAIVLQMGDDGTAVQKQGNSAYLDYRNAYSSYAAIVQLSHSDDSKAEQHQAGVWNIAGIIQGSDRSIAKQEQLSDKTSDPSNIPFDLPNVAGIVQEELGFLKKDNKAYQVQYYDGVSAVGNWAGALQIGGGNVSTQLQYGGNNVSTVSQLGGNNEAYVEQTNGASPTTPMSMGYPLD